ncbi:unnamed protein product [Gongylonema pulchrum]|uniref:CR032 protein n=1 Tax=Gongylonema pulchrum TaxID=637853 RepID=A0A183CX42_9BILA|nr:unnamed protein product [Gongylonema pulchrum]
MVCIPCILLPIVLAIYIKFIQPIIFRLLPESWRTTFDALLYPTCPVPVTQPVPTEDKASTHDQSAQLAECDAGEGKKDI